MVEHDRRSIDAQFVAPAEFGLGSEVTLGPEAAHHMNVLRLDFGARIGVVDGAGRVGGGTLVRLGRRDAVIAVDQVWTVDRPPAVHMIVPVADRDRMLWLAEKCTELGVTSWRPVEWRRSASVSPRGIGEPFRDKVRARMIAALMQSRGAWLPEQFAETSLADALAKSPTGIRLFLDPSGSPLLQTLPAVLVAPVTIAVGPEGGVEDAERGALAEAGFTPASLGPAILRFETAGVAAVAAVLAAFAMSAGASWGNTGGR
jgi:16S rRNA (uracil1498-N3)-methyltransferase